MADDKRLIYRSDFSTERMLEKTPEEARKYFITTFFVPLAYNMWETAVGNYAVLHVVKTDAGRVNPVVSIVTVRPENKEDPWPSSRDCQYGPTIDEESQRRTFGELLNWNHLSEAMKYAFSECFQEGYVWTELRMAPLVATIQKYGFGSFKLNVMSKTKSSVKSTNALHSWAVDRESTIIKDPVFKRWFNSLTGEWLFLCPEGDPDECAVCKKIRASHQAKNAYNLP